MSRLAAAIMLSAALGRLAAADPPIAIASDQPGNVFVGHQGAVAVTSAGAGRAILLDADGAAVSEAQLAAGAPATLVLPGPGYYRIRAVSGEATAECGALVLGRDDPLGARAEAGFFSVDTGNVLAERAGGRWNRAFLDLTSVHVRDGGFAWARRSTADSEWLTADGLDLPADQEWIICLGRPPDAMTTKPVPVPTAERWKAYPPRDWDRFGALVRWAVAGLPPKVRHIEVINEPDANWRGSDEELVRYHQVVAEAVHAARPEARVLGPCLCSVKTDLLTRLDRLGLFAGLDGISIHPYVNGTAPEGEFIARIDALRAWNRARVRPLPIFFTEFGWQTNPKDWQLAVDERTHARYTARSLLMVAARPDIAAQQLFCLLNARPGSWDAYSMIAADRTPRRAYAYAATAMHRLAGAGAIRDLVIGEGMHAVTWKRPGGSGLAMWSTGSDGTVQMPAAALAAWDATGRPIAPPGVVWSPGQDPTYLASDDPALAGAPDLEPRTVLAGSASALPFDAVLASSAVVGPAPGGGWQVRADAPRGRWQVAGHGPTGWSVLPLTVAAPVEAVGSLDWDGVQPVWRIDLTSRLDRPALTTATLAVAGGGPPRIASTTLQPGAGTAVRIPLDRLPWGQRLGGGLVTDVGGDAAPWRDQQAFHATIAALPILPADGQTDRLPAMDITAWAPFTGGGQVVPTARAGLRAQLRLAHGMDGIHLRIEVEDPSHRQDQTPDSMWRQDSIQVAFDADADQPWQPNSGRFWNGHRVAEYGIALGTGGAMCWRWLGANGLPGDSAEPRVQVSVERVATTTRYQAVFPWSVLGLDAPLAAGRAIGFALAVNDVGDAPDGGRAGLRFFYGIVESKDPTRYGRLVLLP